MSQEFDVSKVEFTPTNLNNPELMFKVYQQFCTHMATIADNGHLKPRVRNFHWVDFDKVTEGQYCHTQGDVDCEFGRIWSVFYFKYQLKLSISNGLIYYELVIDLREDPFKDVPLIKSRRQGCTHKGSQRALYWEEGGGAFMEDGSPRHALVCEHCLTFEILGKAKPVVEDGNLQMTKGVRFARFFNKLLRR
ncbi:hypothetical protein NVP1244A_137 [Vibrio phage 1.244.A._10N.261.54.C3]|nr:hypothetical protein NVP1244A_137 [Vibrio phage 1.244.A._10N.261.54.C3]AUR98765.1 hypothetical protein NVP1255O_137 [Vibrio phage 1.255.O._10N.286.45.F1]